MQDQPPPRENLLLNLGFNLLLPILILTQGAKRLPQLEAWQVLVMALAFPIGYFIYDWQKRHKANAFSIIGALSVLLTGGIGLLKLSPQVFAIKEAAIPLVFGLATVVSLKTSRPLVKLFLYNPEVVNVPKIEAALDTPQKRGDFERLQVVCTWLVAASFLLSAVLNYFLARWIVVTDPAGGAEAAAAFNAEVGKQTGVTWIVITVGTMPLMIAALWKFFSGVQRITGLDMEALTHEPAKKAKAGG